MVEYDPDFSPLNPEERKKEDKPKSDPFESKPKPELDKSSSSELNPKDEWLFFPNGSSEPDEIPMPPLEPDYLDESPREAPTEAPRAQGIQEVAIAKWIQESIFEAERHMKYSFNFKGLGSSDLEGVLRDAQRRSITERDALQFISGGGLAHSLEDSRKAENASSEAFLDFWKKVHPIMRYLTSPSLATEKLIKLRERLISKIDSSFAFASKEKDSLNQEYDYVMNILTNRGIASSLIDLQYSAEGKIVVKTISEGGEVSSDKDMVDVVVHIRERGLQDLYFYVKKLARQVIESGTEKRREIFTAIYFEVDQKMASIEKQMAASTESWSDEAFLQGRLVKEYLTLLIPQS